MLKESETDTGQTHKLTNHKESVTLSATLSTFDRPVSVPARTSRIFHLLPDVRAAMRTTCFLPILDP